MWFCSILLLEIFANLLTPTKFKPEIKKIRYDLLCTDPLLQLKSSAADGCQGND